MTTTILEIAICTIADASAADKARHAAMEAIRGYPGFISWRALSAAEDSNTIADLVEWSDKASADAAAAKVQSDPVFAPYIAAISAVTLMQHFHTKAEI
ncbi:hypothetical protein [Rhizobium sp. RU36D]|uniref:hypothetical protein n=1 Tax=Rhizobium sp. RU36D TaxID=1907415 RepID=UPI0009D81012|nr:hypothetical protein SAMN05880593_11656 [Rhizobium sp. RU36D]